MGTKKLKKLAEKAERKEQREVSVLLLGAGESERTKSQKQARHLKTVSVRYQ